MLSFLKMFLTSSLSGVKTLAYGRAESAADGLGTCPGLGVRQDEQRRRSDTGPPYTE
jgi:hypothetical protein